MFNKKEIKEIKDTIVNEIDFKEKAINVKNDNISQFQLTVDGNNAVTLNLDTTTGQQNILLSDDQTSTIPTSFDAIVEIKSATGALLLSRLTSAQMEAMQNPQPGMIFHNIDTGRIFSFFAEHGFINISGMSGPTVSTPGGIITWGNGSGSKIIDSAIRIGPNNDNLFLPVGASIYFVTDNVNDFMYNLSVPSTAGGNLNFVLPDNIPTAGQVLTAKDDQGNTSWTTVNGIGPIITGLTYVGTMTLDASEAITAGDFITDGGLVADGTVSAGTLVSGGDITAASDITSVRLNLRGVDHSLTLEGNIAQASDITLILPPNKGNANQVLSTDGYGNLAWVDNDIIINSSTVGNSVLNGTTGVTISTTAATNNSIIIVTRNMGTAGPPLVTTIGNLIVGSIINQTSFTVYSTTVNDFGNFNWLIINP
jgi:hypothetical protein